MSLEMDITLDLNNIDELRKVFNVLNDKLELLENSKSVICNMILKERELLFCPKCHSTNIKKDGKYKGRQNYKCKDCNKKFNNLTDTIFHHTHLTYRQLEEAFECVINLFSIRKMSKLVNISTKTAFTLRHKIMSCLSEIVNSFILSGEIELDGYYLSINLKGTKPKNMPRIGSTNKVITDCKSRYESIAKENHWNLKQIKSKTYIDEEGNSLANINALHSSLNLYLSNFRGVSTKHLQEYLRLILLS